MKVIQGRTECGGYWICIHSPTFKNKIMLDDLQMKTKSLVIALANLDRQKRSIWSYQFELSFQKNLILENSKRKT